MGASDPALLAALKAVRLQLARERNVPAFVIFSDRTLIDMAARRPHDMDTFAAVHGVGAAKLKDFGGLFLNTIAAHIGVEEGDSLTRNGPVDVFCSRSE